MTRARLSWHVGGHALLAVEPSVGELADHAPALAAAYNDPANATLLGHVDELTQSDVIESYADLADDGARQFLLFVDGALAGDADLRGLDGDGAAEFAFLIGQPRAQGQGLGTRFALMIHAFGFAPPHDGPWGAKSRPFPLGSPSAQAAPMGNPRDVIVGEAGVESR